jgi:hypothetical protein
MNRVKITIIAIGILYSLVIYFLVGEGVQVFGVAGMLGALAINSLWRRSGLPFGKYLTKHIFSILVTSLSAVMGGFAFASHGKEASIAFLLMIPSLLLGLAWFIFMFELPGRLLSSRKKS